ncbi:MAG TPA: biopolymer transporter ExbD [Cyclobacteriaceae bacterium]
MATKRLAPEVSTSSMADVAFLLLTFFLITTVINNDKGIPLLLPPPLTDTPLQPIHDRNLFKIQINGVDQFLVEDKQRTSLDNLRIELKEFILNNGVDESSSDSPQEAVVSIKTDRTTSYQVYLKALDEAQAAYYLIYSERVNLTPEQYRKLDLQNSKERMLYERGKKDIPMNISIAEPVTSN